MGLNKGMSHFTINKRTIGVGHPCFIIAELSGNHHQKYEEAVELVNAAAEAGADAVKLQTYTPDTLTLDFDQPWFMVKGKDQPDSWKGRKLYELYQTAYTPWEWQPKLKKIAEDLGLIFFSTPFDESAVNFLEEMNVPCYKVASYEVVHIPLLRAIARTGKPVIISVGFASLEEVTLAVKMLQEGGTKEIAILHCVTAYSDVPDPAKAHLSTILDLKQRFDVIAGFSDNNAGITIPVIAATHAGASIIEKHLILNKSDGGPDARFSINPSELEEMVKIIRRAEQEGQQVVKEFVQDYNFDSAMGEVHYGPASEQERENMFFRPSLWVKKDIGKGEKLDKENVRVARPSAGLLPKYFDEIIGRNALQDIKRGTPLRWDLID